MPSNEIALQARHLTGNIQIPPSKSIAHRAVICAALSGGKAENIGDSKDIRATLEVLRALGLEGEEQENAVAFSSRRAVEGCAYADCNESGSTLRFLVPLAAALGVETVFTGRGRLPQRPIAEYEEIFRDSGVEITLTNGHLPLRIRGRMRAGRYICWGNITSQYISGLMMALPLVGGGEIEIVGPLESEPYVNLTIDTMARFGVRVTKEDRLYRVSPGPYRAEAVSVEGDYSQAAFWLVAGALSGEITLEGLRRDSLQGDRAIVEILQRFGAEVRWQDERLTVRKSAMRGIEIDARDIPDLVPVLAVAASQAAGVTRIYHAERLRLKESDRLESTCRMLQGLGGSVAQTEDGLIIEGSPLRGGTVDTCNDHRIAMSAAVASAVTEGRVSINQPLCVEKSYPEFYRDFIRLGGEVYGLHLG